MPARPNIILIMTDQQRFDTNKNQASGQADDDWGRFLRLHGLQRPNDRNQTDPQWMQKHQGVPWHLDERFHSDVFIGDSALTWIRDYQGSHPVFLQIGFTGPHEPWDPLPRHLELYQDRPMPPRVFREGELDEKPPQHRAHQTLKQELLGQLLGWLAASTYYNAGYRRDRSRRYNMRWPTADDPYLHGRMSQDGPRQIGL